jgi:hypothetical protein
LILIGAGLSILWGVAHLFPTKGVVEGFGEINEDNKNIITMEWIVEGVALIFIGLLVLSVAIIDQGTRTALLVYAISAGELVVLALVSLFTGYKVDFLPFKLCPFIFSASALLILLGAFL